MADVAQNLRALVSSLLTSQQPAALPNDPFITNSALNNVYTVPLTANAAAQEAEISALQTTKLNVSGDAQALTLTESGTGATTRSLLNRTYMQPLDAMAYGVKADGVTDDAPALRAALAATRTRLNRTVMLPAGTICIGSTIAMSDWSDIQMIGTGTGASPSGVPSDQASLQDGTILKWTGPANGIMLDWQSPSAPRTNLTVQSKIYGIVLDGNGNAGTGLYIRGLMNCVLGIKVRNISANGIDMDVYNGGGADCQHNRFEYVEVDLDWAASQTANGFNIGPGNSYNNTHHNHFGFISIVVRNGTGLIVGNTDSNNFACVQVQYPYTPGTNPYTGIGMDLRAAPNAIGPGGVTQACRSNNFYSVSNVAPTYARAGSYGLPSYGNLIFGYIQDSGEPEPVVETGATLNWFTTFGIMHGFGRFETNPDGAWALAGANAPRTGVSFPAAKTFASLAEFGTDRPLYVLGPNPGIGYNLYYTYAGYRYGPGSNNHFGMAANFDTLTGRLGMSLAPQGNAGSVVSTLNEVWSTGPTGSRLGPSLATAPSSPFQGQVYFDTSLNKYRAWDGSAWQNFW